MEREAQRLACAVTNPDLIAHRAAQKAAMQAKLREIREREAHAAKAVEASGISTDVAPNAAAKAVSPQLVQDVVVAPPAAAIPAQVDQDAIAIAVAAAKKEAALELASALEEAAAKAELEKARALEAVKAKADEAVIQKSEKSALRIYELDKVIEQLSEKIALQRTFLIPLPKKATFLSITSKKKNNADSNTLGIQEQLEIDIKKLAASENERDLLMKELESDMVKLAATSALGAPSSAAKAADTSSPDISARANSPDRAAPSAGVAPSWAGQEQRRTHGAPEMPARAAHG